MPQNGPGEVGYAVGVVAPFLFGGGEARLGVEALGGAAERLAANAAAGKAAEAVIADELVKAGHTILGSQVGNTKPRRASEWWTT